MPDEQRNVNDTQAIADAMQHPIMTQHSHFTGTLDEAIAALAKQNNAPEEKE